MMELNFQEASFPRVSCKKPRVRIVVLDSHDRGSIPLDTTRLPHLNTTQDRVEFESEFRFKVVK